MAQTTKADTVVILDDDLPSIIWMVDYFYDKGFDVIPVATANEAIEEIAKEIYRAAVIDLNVPILPPLDAAAAALGETYIRYPGLYVAREARNRGYRDRQVVIYSVHRDAGVAEEAKKLGCNYILKGRPKEIIDELESVISFDPTKPAA